MRINIDLGIAYDSVLSKNTEVICGERSAPSFVDLQPQLDFKNNAVPVKIKIVSVNLCVQISRVAVTSCEKVCFEEQH